MSDNQFSMVRIDDVNYINFIDSGLIANLIAEEVKSHYLAPKISGTETPWFMDLDLSEQAFSDVKDAYFVIEDFESKYNKSSSDAYKEWREGSVGPEYTDWISAYIKVWDKIKAN